LRLAWLFYGIIGLALGILVALVKGMVAAY
jgi:hypothetical protein